MSEYLSKEEVKQWRSSLEKITLEEFAARLGKKIEEDKPTNDLIDIVLKGKPVISSDETWIPAKAERLGTIADRAYEREREIAPSPFSVSNLKVDLESEKQAAKTEKIKPEKAACEQRAKAQVELRSAGQAGSVDSFNVSNQARKSKSTKLVQKEETPKTLREEVRIVFRKALTDREQRVFDHFQENSNKIVYAKDLAVLLELPRDYVYKYIKNLRAKIEGDKLQNADKGGFVLNV